MGMGHIEVELLIHEHAHKPIKGEVLAVGRQHIAPNAEEVRDMLDRYGVKRRTTSFEVDTLNTHNHNGQETILDSSLFQSFTDAKYYVADISPYEGADFIFDVCGEVPEELIGRFDFIIDGGSLDNVFDPLSMVRNMTKMLKPGGRMFIYAWSNGFPSAYVKITPDWIMDYCLVNEFADAKVYASRCDMPFGDPELGGCVDLYHCRPTAETPHGEIAEASYVRVQGYGSTYCIAEKGENSTSDRMAVQKHYRGENVEPYLTSAKRFASSEHPAFALPGQELPDMPVISDQPTVVPVARFGTPREVTTEEMIIRRLDQIATGNHLIATQVEAGLGTLWNRVYQQGQEASKQIYDTGQSIKALERAIPEQAQKPAEPLRRRLFSRG